MRARVLVTDAWARLSTPRAAFVIVVVVTCVVVGGMFHLFAETWSLSKANQSELVRVARLEKEQAKFRRERTAKTTATDRIICQQLDKLKTAVRLVVVPTRASLLKFGYYREHPSEIPAAIASGKAIAAKFPPTDCMRLPTSTTADQPAP